MLAVFKNVKHKLGVIYRFRYYSVLPPVYTESFYYSKYPPNSYDMLKYMPTVDDPKIIEVAHRLDYYRRAHSDKWMAGFLLAFVQQNVKYVHDSEQYQSVEHWALPINTLKRAEGDCEDSAFLYVALCYHCKLKVISVHVPNHMLAGVALGNTTLWSKITVGGVQYRLAEPTGFLPIVGMTHKDYSKIYHTAAPDTPTEAFKQSLMSEP